MKLLVSITSTISGWYHQIVDHKADILKAAHDYLVSFGLTPEHVAQVAKEVLAVEAAFGKSVNGFVKAGHVADALGTLAGDLALPESTKGSIGGIIGTVHTIIALEQAVAAAV